MSKSRLFRIVATIFALPWVAAGAQGQTTGQAYPARPVRLVVANSTGSQSDVVARVFAAKLSELIGQPVVVDNRGGAGGLLGTEVVARAAPDGYTLIAANTATHSIAPHTYRKLPYDALKDFAPVSQYGVGYSLLVVGNSVPVQSMPELIALAKARPGSLNMSSAGYGSISHLAGSMFSAMAGFKSTHVPYKGGGASVTALVAGEAQWAFTPMSAPLPYVRDGRLRALAISGNRRSPALPKVPTAVEAGLPGFNLATFEGLLAPANTPRAAVALLHAATARALAAADLREQFDRIGIEPVGSQTPDAFGAFLAEQFERYGAAVKAADLKAE